jgi:outer membrane immunogenic protein
MKKLILVSVALVMIGGPAMAQGPPPVAYDWTGLYIGINGGYSWGNSSTNYTITGFPSVSTSQSMDGWVFGGQAGYNKQIDPKWVLGVEADMQATGQDGTASFTDTMVGVVGTTTVPLSTTVTGSLSQKLPWFGTARLRAGYLARDTWMLYVTGGLAFGEIDTNINANASSVINAGQPFGMPVTLTGSNSDTRLGVTAGGGTEFAISGSWTAKLEYLYIDFGTVTNTFTGTGFPAITAKSHVTDNILRAGLNYRF